MTEAAAAGDECLGQVSAARFGALVSPHVSQMLRFACTLTSHDQAPDIVQEALERAWIKRRVFDPAKGELVSWLLGIVYNRARNQRRAATFAFGLREADLAVVGPDSTNVDVRRAVRLLPRQQRAVIILYYYVDLPVAEVANVLGCSAGTVKSTLSDARKNLGTALGVNYVRT